MPIEASQPTTITATYDRWSIIFRQSGDGLVDVGQPGPAPPVSAFAIFTKYRVREDGVSERSPLPEDTFELSVPDLYALAAVDPLVAAALEALVSAVVGVAAAQGAI